MELFAIVASKMFPSIVQSERVRSGPSTQCVCNLIVLFLHRVCVECRDLSWAKMKISFRTLEKVKKLYKGKGKGSVKEVVSGWKKKDKKKDKKKLTKDPKIKSDLESGSFFAMYIICTVNFQLTAFIFQ